MLLREVNSEDAEGLVKLIKQDESESKYMLFEAGERNMEPEQQAKRIGAIVFTIIELYTSC